MAVFVLRIILAALFVTGCASTSSSIDTAITSNVTLSCSSPIAHPSWTGPSGNGTLTFNYDDNRSFNPQLGTKIARLSWGPDNTSLRISTIRREDAGQYDCRGHSTTLNVRVPPQTPEISNTKISEPPRVIATEDQNTTLVCTSRGGYPQPTVEWYRGSTQLSPTRINVTSPATGDVTYTVIVTYTLTARRGVDLAVYKCMSFYTTSPRLEKSSSVQLYLNLKPSPPDVMLMGTPVEGQQGVEVATCSTDGFRPSEGFIITWSYKGTSMTHQGSAVADNNTYKITATYIYTSAIGRVDNGGILSCTVSHGTLSVPFEDYVTLNVRFPPLSAELSGTNALVVDGTNTVQLICTAGTANPGVSVIKWTLDGQVISNTREITRTSGQYDGEVASQVLEITPTRDMAGQETKCFISNVVNSNNSVSSLGVPLDLTYHPIATISAPSPPPIEGQTDVVLVTCTVDSKPGSSVTWYHDGVQVTATSPDDLSSVYTFIVSAVNRTHHGTYTCRADNGILPIGEDNTTLIVNFPPSSASLSGTTDIIAEGTERVRLTCTAGAANPGVTSITWIRNGDTLVNTQDLQITPANFSGEVVTQDLEFVPTRTMDGQEVTCMVSNVVNDQHPVTSNVRTLNLRYAPRVTVEHSLIFVNENGRDTLRCTVSSRPLSSITWRKVGGQDVESGGTNNQLDFTLHRADRTQAGKYSCFADNGVGETSEQVATVVVQYAPDVAVTATRATINDSELTIQCSAVGVPSVYTYSWRHTWPGYGDVNTPDLGPGSSVRLTDLTYEQSGIYTCNVHNGIPDSTNPKAGHGDVTVKVESYPVITWPILENGIPFNIATKLNVFLNISVLFFSNSDNTTVMCQRAGNDTDIGSYIIQNHRIELPIYGNLIETWGQQAVVEMLLPTREELGVYNVFIKNDIGIAMIPVDIQLEGYPYVPTLHDVCTAHASSATVLWSPNFNGGYSQTVVIQVIHGSGTWTNASLIVMERRGDHAPRNTTVTRLVSGTLYYVRLYAFNVLGSGDHSPEASFTTLPDVSEQTSSSKVPIVGVAVGAGVVMVIGVIIVVCLVKRGVCKRKGKGSSQADTYQSLENRNVGTQPYGHISLRDQSNCSARRTGDYSSVHLYDSIQSPEQSAKQDVTASRLSNAYEYPIPREELQKADKQSQKKEKAPKTDVTKSRQSNGYEMPLSTKTAQHSRDQSQKKVSEKGPREDIIISRQSNAYEMPLSTKAVQQPIDKSLKKGDNCRLCKLCYSRSIGLSSSKNATAECLYRDESIAKKDKSIAEQDKSIAKKDKIITEQDKSIAEQDKSIAKKDKTITEQDKIIAEPDKSIAEQNKSITEQDKTIAEKDKIIEKQNNCITEQANSKPTDDINPESGHEISKRRDTYQNLRVE